jgi:hypothetical protein
VTKDVQCFPMNVFFFDAFFDCEHRFNGAVIDTIKPDQNIQSRLWVTVALCC